MSSESKAEALVTAIYNQVCKDLNLPHPLPEQLGITRDSIKDVIDLCIQHGIEVIKAKEIILKMWANSITIK